MNLHAQGGVLIFEISDAQNKPVSDLTIEVKKGDELYKKYVTNESGRVVDASIPSGKYSYSFNYGDLNADVFEIKDGDYTWLNLDYRLWTITFKDDEDTPLEGKKATIYKVDKKRNETFVSEKFSNEVGVVEFLVPEIRVGSRTVVFNSHVVSGAVDVVCTIVKINEFVCVNAFVPAEVNTAR